MRTFSSTHLVKYQDLSHHGNLYAGRSADWMVEAAFSCAAQEHGIPDELVCIKIEEISYKQPVEAGDVFMISSRVVRASGSSIVVHVDACTQMSRSSCVEGFITFVSWDAGSRTSKPHRLKMDEAADARETEIRARAAKFKHNK